MIEQDNNYVLIEGKLSEVDLEKTNDSNGQAVIRGNYKVQLTQTIDGEEKNLVVPISAYAKKLTNAGKPNPAYASTEQIMGMTSIASGGEEEADLIRVTGARLEMNEYFTQDGRKVSFPRVTASFVNRINKTNFQPRAVWECDLTILDMAYELDEDGVETDLFVVTGLVVGWNQYTNIIPFVTRNKQIAEGIKNNYKKGDRVPMSGYLNFTYSVEEFEEEVAIGEPVKKSRTFAVSEVIISGVKAPYEEKNDPAEVKELLQKHKANLETMKEAAKHKHTTSAQPAPKEDDFDLGF